MNINIDEILQAIQDLRSQLEVWGITNEGLWAAGAVAIFLFILSLREVLTWYLRIQQVRDEVWALRNQLAAMQKVLVETKDLLARQVGEDLPKLLTSDQLLSSAKMLNAQDLAKPDKSGSSKFRFDH